MSYTDQEKMQEFERLKDFLESLDLAAEILPKGNVLDDIILLVSLPSIEEYPSDREATEADLHLAAGYLMDLDDTDQRLCKYLLFYSQIIVDLSSFERTEILENINQLNRNVRMDIIFMDRQMEKKRKCCSTGSWCPGQKINRWMRESWQMHC